MVFQIANFNRNTFLYLLEKLTPEQLYFIPEGFNNHILWNIGHVLVTEQLLTYGLSDLKLKVDKKFIKMYGKGSAPNKTVSKEAIEDVKTQLIPVIKETAKDLENNGFKTFKKYPTSVGIELTSVKNALIFNGFHEGIHLGTILSIKKLL